MVCGIALLFYVGDVTGLKARLAVYPNGIESGAGTHVSVVQQNLKTDLEIPAEIECGSFAQIGSTNLYSLIKNMDCM